MPVTVIYITAWILFVGAAPIDLPFGYYNMLRIVTTCAFMGAFLISFFRNGSFLPWIYLLLAITFNPIVKVPLPNEVWMVVFIVAGSLLILTRNKIKRHVTTKTI